MYPQLYNPNAWSKSRVDGLGKDLVLENLKAILLTFLEIKYSVSNHLSKSFKVWIICHRQQWQIIHLSKSGPCHALGFFKHITALLSWVLWIGKSGGGIGGQLRNESEVS